MTSHEYLTFLQALQGYPPISDSNTPPVHPDLDECSLLAKAIGRAANGRFEPHLNADILREAVASIIQGFDVHSRAILSTIAVGEIITNDFNASACRVPFGSSHIVIVNHGLIRLFYAVAMASAHWMALEGTDKRRAQLASKALKFELAFNIKLYLETRGLRSEPFKFGIDGYAMAMACTLTSAATIFVLGHEFAHCVLPGHLDDSYLMVTAVNNEQVQMFSRSQRQEIEADRAATLVAWNWYVSQNDPYSLALGLAGFEMVFGTLRLLEGAATKRTTHPYAMERLAQYRVAMRNAPQSPVKYTNKLWETVDAVLPILNKSANELIPELATALEQLEAG